ncbi:MAG: hypothetical protein IPH45_18720 [Bacteroidales bacterium]|nr:hypothetical protein [Bacteroidales bacterium]
MIGQSHYPKPGSNVKWSKLDKKGIPGLKDTACFISPDEVHPYCEYPTNWGEVCRFKIPESQYQKEFDKIWTCGYYPVWVDGFDGEGRPISMLFSGHRKTYNGWHGIIWTV